MTDVTTMQPAVDDALPLATGKACAACGSPIEEFDKFCTACGTSQPEQAAPVPAAKIAHIRCETCGAEVASSPEQRSYTCPFCDSKYVVEFDRDASERQAPEFVIGFSVTAEQAQEAFHRWISQGGLFRPGDLKAAQVDDRLKGVYLPFWSFSMLAQSGWSASIGEYWYRTETYTTTVNGKRVTRTRQVRETEWWDLAGRHHEYYSGYLVSGSKGLSQADAERVKPFHLPALKRYKPYFLAGWMSEEYSVESDQALTICQAEFARRERAGVQTFLPGDTHNGLNVETSYNHVNSDLVLLPMYLLSYRYHNKVYRFLMNGQTAKIDGDKPLSWKRITGAVATAVAAILLVMLLVFIFGR